MKKTISLLFIALIICSSVLTLNINAVQAQNGSSVSGIISSDTTWTKENSPYNFTGNVLVDTNVTLVIEPGVTVEFNGYFMNIGGTLTAKGTETQKIIMKGSGTTYSGQWNGRIVFLNTSINSTLEFVEITSTPNTIIGVYSSSPTIENCIISGTSGTAISIMVSPNAVPNIANNTIANNKDGILLDSTDTNITPKISSNIIVNNSGSGVILNHGQPQISLNRIANNTYGISYGGGINGNDSCTITDNIISNNTYGIFINPSGFGRNFNLVKNLIINNDNAIYIQHSLGAGRGNVTSNTIAKNNNGIVSTGPVSLVINRNNIYEISNYFVS
jgi:parallel beta-helix repeat protein